MGSVTQDLPLRGKPGASVLGAAMKDEFLFDPEWRNLNHGAMC